MRILYVEDDPHDADITARTLRKSAPHFRLETVTTIGEALARLERIASDPLDLVLTDVHLRDGDGLSLLQHIRERGLPLAVVLVIGMGDEETAVSALKARADDYVVKSREYLGRLPHILESALGHYRADAALRASEERFAKAFQSNPQPMSLTTLDEGLYVDVNESFLAMSGYAREEVIGRTSLELNIWETPAARAAFVGQLVEEGAIRNQEALFRTKSGEFRVLLSSAELMEIGGRQCLLVASSDITERKAADEARRESEKRFRATFEQAAVGVAHSSLDGRLLLVNRKLCDILGYTPEELLPKTYQEVTHPEDLAGEQEHARRLLAGEIEHASYEKRYIRKDGSVVWVNLTVSLVQGDDGAPSYFVAIVQDISARKEAERAIRFQAHLLNTIEQSVIATDMSGVVIFWNQFAESLYGWSPEEAVGRPVKDLLMSEAMQGQAEEIWSQLRKGQSWAGEFSLKNRRGETLQVWVSDSPIFDERENLVGVIGVSYDISERKRAEEALRESEEFNRRIVESSSDCIKILDLEGRLLFISPRGEALLGIEEPGSCTNTPWLDLWPSDGLPAARTALEQAKDGGVGAFQGFGPTPQGQPKWWDTVITPMTDARGRVVRLLAVSRDITESKRAEEALRESEEKYRTLFESIDEGFCVFDMIYDADGRAVDLVFRVTNPAFDRLTGWQNAAGRRVRELLPDLEDVWVQKYGQVAATGEPQRFTERAAGLNKWYDIYAFRVGDAGSRTLAVIFSDVSERIRAMEAIRRSEAVLTQAGQMANLGAWEVDLTHSDNLDESPHVWSEQVYRLFGYEPGSVEPSSGLFFRHVHPDDRPRIDESIRAAITARKPYSLEYRITRADGAERVIHGHALIDADEAGRPCRIIGAMQDITERVRAEEALKSALAEVRQLKDRLQEENIYLQQEVRVASNFGEIIGDSRALNLVLGEAERVAPADTTVLILGETGTGKELMAHAIHNLSPRNRHPLVKVNCAALPAPLIESDLFGHEKGAFTGAVGQRRGRFELADGGTIFLDEVGELPPDLQAKLLRVLEEGEFERVGGSRTLKVDVRVIAATNRRLEEAVREGTFRSDLYYRLSVYPITLPPLRERREDIPVLVTHFVKNLSTKMGKEIETIPQHAMTALKNYSWPGNVRELRNVIERAVIITQGPTLRLTDEMGPRPAGDGAHLPGVPFDSQPAQYPATETLEQSESNLILRTLKRVNWKIGGPGGAAELLDINPSTLRTRMKKLGIAKP